MRRTRITAQETPSNTVVGSNVATAPCFPVTVLRIAMPQGTVAGAAFAPTTAAQPDSSVPAYNTVVIAPP